MTAAPREEETHDAAREGINLVRRPMHQAREPVEFPNSGLDAEFTQVHVDLGFLQVAPGAESGALDEYGGPGDGDDRVEGAVGEHSGFGDEGLPFDEGVGQVVY